MYSYMFGRSESTTAESSTEWTVSVLPDHLMVSGAFHLLFRAIQNGCPGKGGRRAVEHMARLEGEKPST